LAKLFCKKVKKAIKKKLYNKNYVTKGEILSGQNVISVNASQIIIKPINVFNINNVYNLNVNVYGCGCGKVNLILNKIRL